MSKPAAIRLVSNDNEEYIAESQAIQEAPVQPAPVPSAEVSRPIQHATAQAGTQAGENVAAAVQAEPAIGQIKPDAYLVLDGLKMTDRLGQKELAE